MKIEIQIIDSTFFDAYKSELFALYKEAFGQGQSAQFIDEKSTLQYIHQILKEGKGILAMDKGKIVGVLLLTNLSFDTLLPEKIRDKYPLDQSIYINELMVKKSYRGQGIGKMLMQESCRYGASNNYQFCFIRVWVENIPAVNLYQSIGFEEIAQMEHKKINTNKTGFKVFSKIYMYKNLNVV